MKTIEEIYKEVEKEMTPEKFYKRAWPDKPLYDNIWLEVCKRYDIELTKASLEKASKRGEYCYIEQFDDSRYVIDIDDITDEQNIVL